MKTVLVSFFFLLAINVFGQNDRPFIRLVNPEREVNNVHNSRQFISGAVCKGCALTINGKPVTVYATGGFAWETSVTSALQVINLVATKGKQKATKKLTYNYSLPAKPDSVDNVDIEKINTYPEGNLVVSAGDLIKFRVKALPGSRVFANGNTELFEQPLSATGGMPGIYQGEYTVVAADSFSLTRIPIVLKSAAGQSTSRSTDARISMLSKLPSDMIVTKGRLAHLLFGLGEDRLGGSKIGYIDSMIPLKVLGKVGSKYKVRLSKYRSAYIPDDIVDFLPKGAFTPASLTENWRVWGDALYDYVEVSMGTRLPYQSLQQIDSTKIIVDVYGATTNTNWIIQQENAKEVKDVFYEQMEDEILRITINLKHQQHWGYSISYNGNRLVIRIKRQPASLALNRLKIAVDAGHGGANRGASGPSGGSEKKIALDVALKLQHTLEEKGAQVIMTRTTEKYFDNKDRILFYRDSLPDLLLSLHLNSSGDPVNVTGISTYYRHPGFRDLSHSIYKRILELGVNEYGNTGSFNFMLNSPTEYPNALVEMLFISNPADEAKMLDPVFQQFLVDKIVLGVDDFLAAIDKSSKN